MREFEHNVVDLNAMRTERFAVARHPKTQTMRTQLHWMTRSLIDCIDELVRDLLSAAGNGEATDTQGAARVARELGEANAQMRAKLDPPPETCILFPRARAAAPKSGM
jgi:hypothetical protein